MNALTRFTSACLALAVIFSAGCGGGGGGDGGVVNPPPTTPPPTGGITRTGVAFAVGPITGFGSVIVNGATYSTDGNTNFTKDGQQGVTQDNFAVGEVVVIKGSIDDNDNVSADSVESNDVVEGPIASMQTIVTQTGVQVVEIVVLGQTVWASLTTSIDDSCPASLTTADAVEVYGIPDVDGVIDATRIECKFLPEWDGVMEVNGFATNVTASTFEINALTVDYSGVGVLDNDFPGGMISEGDPVEAKGINFDPVTLTATDVEYKGNQFAENEGDHIEIEGFITLIMSATDFDVSGRPVTTIAGTTVFEGGPTGTSADLNENLKVEVEGEFDGSGVLVATKVEIKTATAIRVTGRLDSDPPGPLAVLGITIHTDSLTTRFEDKAGDNPLDQMNEGNLFFDDYVEIRGQEMPTGEITAMIVERDDPDDSRIELRGFVTSSGEPNLTVLGVTIFTIDGTTIYRDSRGATEQLMDPMDFWAAVAVGSLVDARGAETDTATLTATELELEME